jgi:hypothetical protein
MPAFFILLGLVVGTVVGSYSHPVKTAHQHVKHATVKK